MTLYKVVQGRAEQFARPFLFGDVNREILFIASGNELLHWCLAQAVTPLRSAATTYILRIAKVKLDISPMEGIVSRMNPFTVQRIDHLVLRVVDLDRSICFYGSILGCHVVKERRDLGLVHLRAGASMIDIIDIQGVLGRVGGAAPEAERRNVDHLCLRIEPFDEAAIFTHLASFGIKPLGPVGINFGAEGEGQSLYFRDPDGNTIELKGPSSHAESDV